MSGQFFRFISILHLLNLVCTTNSRPFVPNDSNTSSLGTQQFSPRSLETTLSIDKTNGGQVGFEEAEYSEVSRIGSSPPSCEHKCYGCMPCEAIQVPTTTSHVGVQYANYEPEGWKCKCGPTFYTP